MQYTVLGRLVLDDDPVEFLCDQIVLLLVEIGGHCVTKELVGAACRSSTRENIDSALMALGLPLPEGKRVEQGPDGTYRLTQAGLDYYNKTPGAALRFQDP